MKIEVKIQVGIQILTQNKRMYENQKFVRRYVEQYGYSSVYALTTSSVPPTDRW